MCKVYVGSMFNPLLDKFIGLAQTLVLCIYIDLLCFYVLIRPFRNKGSVVITYCTDCRGFYESNSILQSIIVAKKRRVCRLEDWAIRN